MSNPFVMRHFSVSFLILILGSAPFSEAKAQESEQETITNKTLDPDAAKAPKEVSSIPNATPSEPSGASSTDSEASSHRTSQQDPVVVHATGLESELDGNMDQALQLFRQAHRLSPEDEVIAYDLARLSFEQKSSLLEQDIAGFLKLEPTTPDSSLLRAYLLVNKGENDAARAQVNRVLAIRPGDPEALELAAVVAPPPKPTAPPRTSFVGRFKTGMEYDTNVTLLPEDVGTLEAAARAFVEGALLFSFNPKSLRFDAGLIFSGSAYATNRTAVSEYEGGSATVFASLEPMLEALRLRFQAQATEVRIESFEQEFMQSFGGSAEISIKDERLEPGFYAGGGFRNFIDADESGRDGPQGEVGLFATFRQRGLKVNLRVGGILEQATKEDQKVKGLRSRAALSYRLKDFTTALALAYEYRRHNNEDTEGESTGRRIDQRIEPSLSLFYAFAQQRFVVSGTYAFGQNLSTKDFDYTRHRILSSVEVRW